MIDYYLRQPAQNVQLQILDAKGSLVRSYSSAPIAAARSTPPARACFLGTAAAAIAETTGEHRVSWDMRYPTPLALFFDQSMGAVPEDTPFIPEGPMALPG